MSPSTEQPAPSPWTRSRNPHQQQSPGQAHAQVTEAPWPSPGSLLESCFQRNLGHISSPTCPQGPGPKLSRCKTIVYLHVGISERGCDRISLHVPQGAFLHFSAVNPVLTPSPGIHVGLRILMPLTPGSAPITPVLIPRIGCFCPHHRDGEVNIWRGVQ